MYIEETQYQRYGKLVTNAGLKLISLMDSMDLYFKFGGISVFGH